MDMNNGLNTQLTFLSVAPRAKTFQSQVSEQDWLENVAVSSSSLLILFANTAPAGLFGKMCPECLQVATDKTLQTFWDCSLDAELKSRKTDGEMRGMLPDTKTRTALHGVSLTLNIPEWTGSPEQCHNGVGVSSLSDILEQINIPHRYYLTSKACAGILRASIATSIADGAGTSGEEQPLLTAPVASTLNANYGTKYGQDNQHVDAGCPLFVCTLGHSQSNGLGVSNANVANTLEATASVNQAVFDRQSSGEYSANDVASTVSARDYKSPSDLIACSPIAFDCLAGGKTGNATGDIPGALHGVGRAAIATKTQVRRLMPIECERLMGFPDNYTKLDEKTADAPRYKALGNSMAVNCMRWVGERIQLVENFLSEKLEAAE